MHLAIEPHAFEHAAAIGFERTAEVMDRYSGLLAMIRLAIQEGTFLDSNVSCRSCAILRRRRNPSRALYEPGDIGWVILTVAVDREENLPACLIECGR